MEGHELLLRWLTRGGALLVGTNLTKNKDLGQRFMTAYLKVARDYIKAFSASKEGRADAASILTKYSAVKDPAFYDQMEMPCPDPISDMDMKGLDFQHDFYVRQGMNTGKLTPKDVIDTSYASYAAQKLGRQ